MTEATSFNSAWLTPPQLARRLGISPEKVLTWIRNGELRSANVVERLNGRLRWRISPAPLEEFVRRRESKPPPPTYPRRSYAPRNGAGRVVRENDRRLGKNIPHEVRVTRMAVLMAARKSGQFSEWRPFVTKAVARYAEKTGVQVDEDAVLALKAWWEEMEE